jgi:hypothetical protein
MFKQLGKFSAALAVTVLLAACSGGGHPRGLFSGYVMGKTEAEVIDKVGKPVKIERGADQVRLVYEKRTFNPDDSNKTDNQTIVLLRKDDQGKVTAYDVDYQ